MEQAVALRQVAQAAAVEQEPQAQQIAVQSVEPVELETQAVLLVLRPTMQAVVVVRQPVTAEQITVEQVVQAAVVQVENIQAESVELELRELLILVVVQVVQMAQQAQQAVQALS